MKPYDVLIIGGGIAGACCAREAALSGLSVMLLEMMDYAWATSRANTRLIHGGLRYLLTAVQGLDPGSLFLVSESLRERNRLMQAAPHLVKPLQFLIPIYRHSPWYLRSVLPHVGFTLYNSMELPGRPSAIGWHQSLSRQEVLSRLPVIRDEELRGGVLYWDAQAPYVERLVIENLLDAKEHGAQVLNHVGVEAFEKRRDGFFVIRARDTLNNDTLEFHSHAVANCAGPWVDRVLGCNGPVDKEKRRPLLGGTRGSHIFVPRPEGVPPDLALYAPSPEDGRPLFLIPLPGRLLMHGTTDIGWEDDPGTVTPQSEELQYLQRSGCSLVCGVDFEQVSFSYAGVRPLAYSPGQKESQITRRHFVVPDKKLVGLFSVVGCKLTPARHLAATLVKQMIRFLHEQTGKKFARTDTASEPLPGGRFESLDGLLKRVTQRALDLRFSSDQVCYLVDLYGQRALKVLDSAKEDPEAAQRLCPDHPSIGAQVSLACREEDARTVDDVIQRRLCVLCATCGHSDKPCRQSVERIMNKAASGSR